MLGGNAFCFPRKTNTKSRTQRRRSSSSGSAASTWSRGRRSSLPVRNVVVIPRSRVRPICSLSAIRARPVAGMGVTVSESAGQRRGPGTRMSANKASAIFQRKRDPRRRLPRGLQAAIVKRLIADGARVTGSPGTRSATSSRPSLDVLANRRAAGAFRRGSSNAGTSAPGWRSSESAWMTAREFEDALDQRHRHCSCARALFGS